MTLAIPTEAAKGWSSLRSRDAPPQVLPWVTGRYYTCYYDETLQAVAASLTLLRGVPIYVPNPTGVTVTSIGVEVTAGGTTSSARFGVYGMLQNGLPGPLIIDGGTVATTGTGFVSVSVSQVLRQGWYVIAGAHKAAAAPTVRRFNGTVANFILGFQYPLTIVANSGYIAINDATTVTSIVDNGLPQSWPVVSENALFSTTQDRMMVGI